MNLDELIGLPYCVRNIDGYNCWAFVGLVYLAHLGVRLPDYHVGSGTPADISAAFITALSTGSHGFREVNEPEDYDVVLFGRNKNWHCGIWFQSRVLHCSKQTAGVSYQELAVVKRGFRQVTFWRL